MNTKKISILVITIFMVFSYVNLSNAEQVVLCLSSTDQYVVAVGQDGECLEEETQIKIMGPNLADLNSLTPVASFEDYKECDTEGTVTKIGFDKNSNLKLDEDEIESVSKVCAVAEEEESEG